MQCIKIHMLFIWRADAQYLSLPVVPVMESQTLAWLVVLHPRASPTPKDSGFPHSAVSEVQRHFCFLGIASHFFALWLVWLDSHILFNSPETLSDDTKSATHKYVKSSGHESTVGEQHGKFLTSLCAHGRCEPILTAHFQQAREI